jgi:ribosome recycling factor
MTKPCAVTKGTTQVYKSVNVCSTFQIKNVKSQNVLHQAPFSTSARSLKTKIAEVFGFNFSLNRLISDHEESRRFYAKGRGIQSNKKTVVRVNEEEMSELIDVEAYKAQLDELTEQMRNDFIKQLSVRNAAGALEQLEVEFDGDKYPLQELAQVGRKTPQLAVLNLSSLPDACQAVMKAIQDSGMNLNPQQEGTTIYVPLPKVTREHRENLSRNAKSLFTKYKTAYQTVQNRYVKQCRSSKEGVSEDLVFSVQKQIMKLASDYIQEAEKLLQIKQKELLQLDK